MMASTANNNFGKLIAVLRKALHAGRIKDNFIAELKPAKESKTKKEFLTMEELKRLAATTEPTARPLPGSSGTHTYQGYDLVSSLAAFGVTFIGALYFSWMYAAWNFNLWVVFGLHFLMNAAWGIFNVAGTEVAAGGLISNIVRIISIALAIGITIYYHKKKGEKVFDYPIWSF